MSCTRSRKRLDLLRLPPRTLRNWLEAASRRKASPVVIDPEVAFGIPVVRGVRTEVIHELFDAGDSIELIADGYDLPRETVEAAIRFETRREPRPAPAAA